MARKEPSRYTDADRRRDARAMGATAQPASEELKQEIVRILGGLWTPKSRSSRRNRPAA